MTLQEWLRARRPAQPPELGRRIFEIASTAEDGSLDIPAQCLAAAEHGLRDLLKAESAARESALDVLAIDALVTYAFEAAAGTPERIPELASQAMSRLSRLPAPT